LKDWTGKLTPVLEPGGTRVAGFNGSSPAAKSKGFIYDLAADQKSTDPSLAGLRPFAIRGDYLVGSDSSKPRQMTGFVMRLSSKKKTYPSSGMSTINAVTAKGECVGGEAEGGGKGAPPKAKLWSTGSSLTIGALEGDIASQANDINSERVIVGASFKTPVSPRAFRYDKEVMEDISSGLRSAALAINDSGCAVGAVELNGRRQAALWEPGSTKPKLLESNERESAACTVSPAGIAAGWIKTKGGPSGVLWIDGKPLIVNDLLAAGSKRLWDVVSITGLDEGQTVLVGIGRYKGDKGKAKLHAFVARAAP
ncbi:MAG: hypothetical protein DCC75_06085, partial [Proteobacteria bacterium]